MIISIEGPDKCGKTHLIGEILQGFEPDKSHEKVFSNRDYHDGFGYLPHFIDHLDSNQVSVWHRSWVSESVYGTLLCENRLLAKDEFLAEWFYSRALIGRGGNFILLPVDPYELGRRRDETDFDEDVVDPIAEYQSYKNYAERWGYEVLLNDYSSVVGLIENTVAARKSAFIPAHKIPSSEYIGSVNPTYTFVGQTRNEFDFRIRPFYSRASLEYFRPFGVNAIRQFGYSSIEGFRKNHKRFPHLFKRVLGVGGAANKQLPELPNLFIRQGTPTGGEVARFYRDFEEAAARHYSWGLKAA